MKQRKGKGKNKKAGGSGGGAAADGANEGAEDVEDQEWHKVRCHYCCACMWQALLAFSFQLFSAQ